MRGADPPFLVPFDRNADRLALIVDAFDREHRDGGEVARPLDVLSPAVDQAVVGHLLQQALQADPLAAGEPEGARDLALAGLAGMLGDECEDRLAGRKLGA